MHPKRASSALYAALLSTSLTASFLISAPAFAKYDKRFEQYGNRTAAQILGVDRDAEYADYKSAYRKLVVKYHSDKNGNTSNDARMIEINAAWDYVDGIDIARRQALMEEEESEQALKPEPPPSTTGNPSEELLRAAKAYGDARRSRDAELMQVLNDNFRTGELQPVIALIERRFKADIDNLLTVFTDNLYLGPASDLLLRASAHYLFKKYPQFADPMMEIYYVQLETRLENIAPSVQTSEEARRQGIQLLNLLHTLEQARLDFGRKPRKTRPGRHSCEEEVASKVRR